MENRRQVIQTDPDPEQARFLSLTTPREVASFFDIPYSKLVFHLYKSAAGEKYTTFRIPKKSGGWREICAPISALKIVQQKLDDVLQKTYQPKRTVHGFVPKRNIVTNAKIHCKKKYVANIDLRDFFPTVNFGRVRGLFMAYPFSFNSSVATVIAQICCFDGRLPQGAPTSPVISNLICRNLDTELADLARRLQCHYTRYADDLTFSTSLNDFPMEILETEGGLRVGVELNRVVLTNGFEINSEKIRFRTRKVRQVVTGLTVNRKPNVPRRYFRRVRAMLHAWKVYGLKRAQAEHFERYDTAVRKPGSQNPSFRDVVIGHVNFIGMVRGKQDPAYQKLCKAITALDPESKARLRIPADAAGAVVFTEGKTDWRHLRKAQEKLGLLPGVTFSRDDGPIGGEKLLALCKDHLRTKTDNKVTIFVFDRDKPDIVKQAIEDGRAFKGWGRGVYTMAIPIPKHREGFQNICIEFYYDDKEIMTVDKEGRRLFLSSEFRLNGRHKDLPLNYLKPRALRDAVDTEKARIISDNVFEDENSDKDLALSKVGFANYIVDEVEPFNGFDFEPFREIFTVIESILEAEENSKTKISKVVENK
jgi:RNA-directed DNA polymerase